jgi:hypothetical protein
MLIHKQRASIANNNFARAQNIVNIVAAQQLQSERTAREESPFENKRVTGRRGVVTRVSSIGAGLAGNSCRQND